MNEHLAECIIYITTYWSPERVERNFPSILMVSYKSGYQRVRGIMPAQRQQAQERGLMWRIDLLARMGLLLPLAVASSLSGKAFALVYKSTTSSRGTCGYTSRRPCRSRLGRMLGAFIENFRLANLPRSAARRSSHVFVTSVRMASTSHRTASIIHAGSLTVHTMSCFPAALHSFRNL